MAEHSFPNAKEVLATADSVWWGLSEDDWREAIAGLAPIENRQDLAEATPEIMARISDAAISYRDRYRQQFVTTVLGKTGLQILQLILDRTERDDSNPLRANAEQALQIARNRLKRLLPRA